MDMDDMENKQHSEDVASTHLMRKSPSANSLLAPRWQSTDMPFRGVLEDSGPGLPEYVQILRRRKGILILITGLGLLVSLLLTIPQTPIYEARGSIEIQSLNSNFLNMRNVSPTADDGGPTAPGYDVQIQTQASILRSESLIDRVVAKLDLGNKILSDEGSGRLARWRKVLGLSRNRQAPTRENIMAMVASNLKVGIDANTRLVEIRYDSPDPKLASDFVNTLTSEFVQQNLESHLKTSQQTGAWLTTQMEDVRLNLEKAEDELQSYAKVAGLVFTSENGNVAEEKLRQFQEQLSKAQEDRVAIQSKYELASKASPDSLPEVLDDPTLKDYQVKLTDLRRQLADISSSLTLAHPAVMKVQAQVTTLEIAFDEARANVIQRIQNEYQIAQRREHLLTANYASQASLVTDQSAKVTHYNILKNEVDTDRQLYGSMLQNVQQAGMASALGASNIRIVDTAIPPSRPYKPSFILNSGLGILAGGFLGLGFVVVQERAGRSIQGPGDATTHLGIPELGAIPAAKAERNPLFSYYYRTGGAFEGKKSMNGRPLQMELVTSSKLPSVLADSFRATLTSILYSGDNGNRPRVIVITSGSLGEGKTSVASNLALALAEMSRPVSMQPILLIDGDMRKPRLHEIFGVPNRWGLSDLLEGKTPPAGCEAMVFKTGFMNLFLLPSGSPAANAAALLHSPRVVEFLNRMRGEFHTIIIDTPPMLHIPDARILGRCADGVVLVVRSAQTLRHSALAVKQRLTEDGTRILGMILNQWDPRETNEYGGGYFDKRC
jgi:succinoglycan biosynthesis transport protein ExoP